MFCHYLFFYYIYKKRYSIFTFIYVAIVFFLSSLPKIVVQLCNIAQHGANKTENSAIVSTINTYATQIGETGALYVRYPSFWCFLSDEHGGEYEDYYRWKIVTVLFTVAMLVLLLFGLLYIVKDINKQKIIYIAFIVSYTCVLFLPSMMDRYGYIYEILSIIIALNNKKTIPLAVTLNIMTIYQYGEEIGVYMFPFPLAVMAMINVAVYTAYCINIISELKNQRAEKEECL